MYQFDQDGCTVLLLARAAADSGGNPIRIYEGEVFDEHLDRGFEVTRRFWEEKAVWMYSRQTRPDFPQRFVTVIFQAIHHFEEENGDL